MQDKRVCKFGSEITVIRPYFWCEDSAKYEARVELERAQAEAARLRELLDQRGEDPDA